MNHGTLIFLLHLLSRELVYCFPVTPGQGGNRSADLFFCKVPGCAADVTVVFCNDVQVFRGLHITECAGRPTPKSVCQRDGRAFVSVVTGGQCEFEGKGIYILTEKCKDHNNSICAFTTDPSSPKPGHIVYILCGVIGLLLIIICLGVYFYKKRKKGKEEQNPQPER